MPFDFLPRDFEPELTPTRRAAIAALLEGWQPVVTRRFGRFRRVLQGLSHRPRRR